MPMLLCQCPDDVVIAAARRSSMWRSALSDHVCTKTNDTTWSPSPSVTNLRPMLESCDNRARREKDRENIPQAIGVYALPAPQAFPVHRRNLVVSLDSVDEKATT